MRYIFVDEAGKSEKEPLTVVTGVIAHADAHVIDAETMVNEVCGAVPPQYAEDFVFHATDIWNNRKYKEDWSQTDRLALMVEMMRIPRRLRMALSFSIVRREMEIPKEFLDLGMKTKEEYHHFYAFLHCLQRADKYIREYAAPKEVATVVAEDVPEMRKWLDPVTKIPGYRRSHGINSRKDALEPTLADKTPRQIGNKSVTFVAQEGDMRLSRIRQSIHFVKKNEEPLTQLADACAFGLRRYFCGADHGDKMAYAILGHYPRLEDYAGETSTAVVFWHPNKHQALQPFSTVP
ncbi:hypothetical protein B1812_14180 [Methylocystis bryophila]|uniref:DUF3800 domain-containing protein n=1 Tax=Methylocystis bryophila TaxID=655015 RepID=A0A1W6MWR4_9HYPH|nr:hypothetical protein B1812_14180 [Methylocystis bryophila]